ncbi:pentapeptide repeat-containing protein [Rothia mucilaginosa]|uniref:pentapeptide repeat-containing protein n=1 Tax=Rothia mucilaginosa TaxID=43675 RepID=UPI0034D600DB
MPENVSPPSLNSQNQEDKKPRFNLYTWLFDNPAHFFWIIVLLGLIGGLAALMVPNCIDWQIPSNNSADTKVEEIRQKSISDLRLHILYITGGIIAILTLLQNSWKNQIDRRKIEDDIQKNKNDHNHQVHAERRSRYTKAVEHLASDKATIRLGGVYTLVGLVDEWLADDPLGQEKQQKEGQVIINNLCSYVRSPFLLAALRKDLDKYTSLTEDDIEKPNNNPRVIFLQEQEIRIAIFTEISKRLENSTNDHEDASGLWNKFKYNFREADIFYPLADLHFSSPDFSGAKFYGNTSFSSSKFIGDANFKFAVYEGITSFLDVNFEGTANFYRANFAEKSSFAGASFNGGVDFNRLSYNQEPLFIDEIEGEIHQARFSCKTKPEEYKYTDKELEIKTIKTKDIEYENKTYTIPLEAVLYNPDNPSASTVS